MQFLTLATAFLSATMTVTVMASHTPLSKRDTTVTFCDKDEQGLCGGNCKTVTSGPACVPASNTACLKASANVAFCANGDCTDCNNFSSCGTKLADGFCATPATKSILISA
ncbi:hypothetical protein D9757_011090 [Collybiopsis confluens]|uniref:Antifreeze protein n=1 Tax=Collybiopsis confluens TaxID=2823264 RepID=A0A8H5GXC5_9AGAR|nr:hypothetical protein D9757_011090 [Collybiopsis confluens]